MDDRSKGFSLRQKKPNRREGISDGKQTSKPTKSNRPNVALEPSKDALAQRPKAGGTSDLVKRRYSTRFNQLPDFNNADAPPMPNLPLPQLKRRSRTPSPTRQRIAVDVAALKDPHLQADKYSTTVLADASDADLREYQSNLRKTKNRTSTDLQLNVYQNRTQFVAISKEAEKLKGEMRTLRGLISELQTSIGSAAIGSTGPESRASNDNNTVRARKQANRSSVANLEAMWNTQLYALWKSVEGSQRFLPAIPGRHIVHETGHWVELDAATWKARRPVHMFLLNDQLLIATKKKRRAEPSAVTGNTSQETTTKIVADKCWPLQDIDILDLSSATAGLSSDRSEMSNAISIRHGNESFTYRIDKSSGAEKGDLLLAFRRTADELRRTLKAETEDLSNKSKENIDYFAAKTPALAKQPEVLKANDRPEILIEVDGKHQNLRWVEGQIDELESEVALHKFEDAVRHVEKLRRVTKSLKGNVIAQEHISTKIDTRARKLADIVAQRLIITHAQMTATQQNVAWLVRLDFDDRARESYLQARTDVIAQRARLCIFEGDLRHYIFQLSYVYFTLIKHTVRIYQQCFQQPMMSACVKWAKEHLDRFNVILARQLSSVQRDSPTWKDCIERAREHAMMMDEVGLDFKNLISAGIPPGENKS